jgi:hypothetical protein
VEKSVKPVKKVKAKAKAKEDGHLTWVPGAGNADAAGTWYVETPYNPEGVKRN